MEKKKQMEVQTENLAVPEVLIEDEELTLTEDTQEEEVCYDNLAIPEIHIRKKNK